MGTKQYLLHQMGMSITKDQWSAEHNAGPQGAGHKWKLLLTVLGGNVTEMMMIYSLSEPLQGKGCALVIL